MSIARSKSKKAPRTSTKWQSRWGAVLEAERVAASHLAALEAGRKTVEMLLSNWAEAEARAEAARQSMKG